MLLEGANGAESGKIFQPDHPAIASLLDVGICHELGTFFVFEFVNAESLESYLRTNQSGMAKRGRLFQELCDAVHQAHLQHSYIAAIALDQLFVRSDGGLKVAGYFRKPLKGESDSAALKPMAAHIAKDICRLKKLLPVFLGEQKDPLFETRLKQADLLNNREPSVLDFSKAVQAVGMELFERKGNSGLHLGPRDRLFWLRFPLFPIVSMVFCFLLVTAIMNASPPEKATEKLKTDTKASQNSMVLLLDFLKSSDPTIAEGASMIPPGLWERYASEKEADKMMESNTKGAGDLKFMTQIGAEERANKGLRPDAVKEK